MKKTPPGRDRSEAVSLRLERQGRIPGWNQKALTAARLGIVGDNGLLASLILLGAIALGIEDVVVLSPSLDFRLVGVSRRLNPEAQIRHLAGFFVHPAQEAFINDCSLVVDVCHYALGTKLLLNFAYASGVPVLRAQRALDADSDGYLVFAYHRGREWQELEELLDSQQLPGVVAAAGVLDLVTAGLILEECKNVLMGWPVADGAIGCRRPRPAPLWPQGKVGVIGAGALGTFVGLGLALAGWRRFTCIDPDTVESTNLNRQVFFYDAVGKGKASTLAARLNRLFDLEVDWLETRFAPGFDLSGYSAVFECVDNFDTRLAISEECRRQEIVLISGGTSAAAGQVLGYDPRRHSRTPAEILGLEGLIEPRSPALDEQEAAACTRQPQPAVIMSNMVIGGLMVNHWLQLLSGGQPTPLFYDAASDRRLGS